MAFGHCPASVLTVQSLTGVGQRYGLPGQDARPVKSILRQNEEDPNLPTKRPGVVVLLDI